MFDSVDPFTGVVVLSIGKDLFINNKKKLVITRSLSYEIQVCQKQREKNLTLLFGMHTLASAKKKLFSMSQKIEDCVNSYNYAGVCSYVSYGIFWRQMSQCCCWTLLKENGFTHFPLVSPKGSDYREMSIGK